jgi:TolB-like protein
LDGVQLTLDPATFSVDLWEFEEAVAARDYTRAQRLYTGPFLAGAEPEDLPALHRLVLERRSALTASLEECTVTQQPAAQVRVPASEPISRRRSRAAALLTLALCLAAVMVVRPAKHSDGMRVLVVGFRNSSGRPDLDRVSASITTQVAQELTRSGVAEVTEWWMSSAPGDADRSNDVMLDLARERNATAILSGNIYRVGDSAVIEASLTDVRSGTTVPITPPTRAALHRPEPTILSFRRKVAGAMAAMQDPLLVLTDSVTANPPSIAAWRAYVLGVHSVSNGIVANGLPYFLDAIRLDPQFHQARLWALAALSPEDAREHVHYLEANRAGLDRLERLRLDHRVAVLNGEREQSYAAARRLVRLSPHSLIAREILADAAMHTQRFREAGLLYRQLGNGRHAADVFLRSFRQAAAAFHLARDYQAELETIDALRARAPRDFDTCLRRLRPLSALRSRTQLLREVRTCGVLSRAGADVGRMEALLRIAPELRAHGDLASADSIDIAVVAMASQLRRTGRIGALWEGLVQFEAGSKLDAYPIFSLVIPERGPVAPRMLAAAAIASMDAKDSLRLHDYRARLDSLAPTSAVLHARARTAAAAGETAHALRLVTMAFMHGDDKADLHADRHLHPLWQEPYWKSMFEPRS